MTDLRLRKELDSTSVTLNSLWSILAYAASRGTNILCSIFLARHLSISEFAEYNYFVLTVAVMANYASLGLGVTATKLFARASFDRAEIDVVRILLTISLLLGLAGGLLVTLLPRSFWGPALDAPKPLYALGVLIVACNTVPTGGVMGIQRFRAAAIVAVLSGVTQILGIAIAAAMEDYRIGVLAFLGAASIQLSGNLLIISRVLTPEVLRVNLRWCRSELQSIIFDAGPMMLVSLLAALGPWLIGRALLQAECGKERFAEYSIGLQWYALVLFIPGVMAKVVLPKFVAMRSTEGSQQTAWARQLAQRTLAVSSAMALLVGLFVVGLGPVLMGLYGSSFKANPQMLTPFCIAGMVLAPAHLLGNRLVAEDKQGSWLILVAVWFSLISIGAVVMTKGTWSSPGWILVISAAVLVTTSFAVCRAKGLV